MPRLRAHHAALRHPAIGIGALLLMAVTPANAAAVDEAALRELVPIATLQRAPSVTIRNEDITARIYLPDAMRGFYRGSRFDWAGVIGSLTYRGHDYYAPWFIGMSPLVRDFAWSDGAAVASPNTAATGPVEEFNAEGGALGFAEAAPGGRFVKIGVGVLQRPDATPFSPFMRYAIVDQGRRTSRARRDHVVFTHAVADAESGYGYRYVKTLRLLKGLPVMLIEHELQNTGRKPIATRVYNHNFLNIDGVGTRAGLEMTTPFAPIAEQPLDPQFASIDGQRLVYRASPGVEQRVSSRLGGFGSASSDYDFRIIDRASGAGLRITGDQPLDRVVLWSIRPVMSIEPFLMMSIPVGGTHRWTYRYEFSAAGSTAVATTP